MMEKRELGKSGIFITPIGLGTIQFSQGRGFIGRNYKPLDQGKMDAIVKASLEGGINWFDTAEVYGYGKSEEGLSMALNHAGQKAGEVVVATKWNPLMRTASNIPRTIADRLKNLGGYPIDLHQIHMPISFSSIPAQIKQMAALVKARKIRSVGVSNFSARQMKIAYDVLQAEGIPLVSNQVRISLLHRAVEQNGVLEMARKLGITLIAHSPLGSGFLTGRYHVNTERLKDVKWMFRVAGGFNEKRIAQTAPLIAEMAKIADAYGVTVTQIALNWLISYYGDTVVTIPGASRPEQALANAAVMDFSLTRGELNRLAEISKNI